MPSNEDAAVGLVDDYLERAGHFARSARQSLPG